MADETLQTAHLRGDDTTDPDKTKNSVADQNENGRHELVEGQEDFETGTVNTEAGSEDTETGSQGDKAKSQDDKLESQDPGTVLDVVKDRVEDNRYRAVNSNDGLQENETRQEYSMADVNSPQSHYSEAESEGFISKPPDNDSQNVSSLRQQINVDEKVNKTAQQEMSCQNATHEMIESSLTKSKDTIAESQQEVQNEPRNDNQVEHTETDIPDESSYHGNNTIAIGDDDNIGVKPQSSEPEDLNLAKTQQSASESHFKKLEEKRCLKSQLDKTLQGNDSIHVASVKINDEKDEIEKKREIQEENERLTELVKDLQCKITSLEVENEVHCSAKNALGRKDIENQEELVELRERVDSRETEMSFIVKQLEEKHNCEKEKLKDSYKKEKNKVEKRIREKEDALTSKKEKLSKLKREKEKAEFQIASDKEYKKKLHERIQAMNDQLQRDRNMYERQIREKQQNFNNLSYQYHEVVQHKAALFERNQILKEEKKQLEIEKETLLLRLSKVAGANLTYNNPNVADLSDEKRPTKLAEEFSELYDNEWTDAFEETDMDNEEEKTVYMLKLIKRANQLCLDISNGHMKKIKDSVSTLTIPTAVMSTRENDHNRLKDSIQDNDNHIEVTEPLEKDDDCRDGDHTDITCDYDVIGEDEVQGTRLCQKSYAEADGKTNKETDNGNNELSKKTKNTDDEPTPFHSHGKKSRDEEGILEDSDEKRHIGVNPQDDTIESNPIADPEDKKESPSGDDPQHRTLGDKSSACYEDNKTETRPAVVEATPGTDVCETHDSESDNTKKTAQESKQKDNKKDITDQKPKKQKLWSDFELLPTDKKKAILEAGQFFELEFSEKVEMAVADIVTQEEEIDKEKNRNVVKYIKKCVNICWSMYRHEPPVYIDFPDLAENDIPFDTNIYKPYTKSGKHVAFVVWPAVYLHKGGPMLSKGVAQGK